MNYSCLLVIRASSSSPEFILGVFPDVLRIETKDEQIENETSLTVPILVGQLLGGCAKVVKAFVFVVPKPSFNRLGRTEWIFLPCRSSREHLRRLSWVSSVAVLLAPAAGRGLHAV